MSDYFYDKHLGYSHSIEEGLKRHSEAAKKSLIHAATEVEILDTKKHLSDLARWQKFFDELMEGFQGTLHKMRMKEEAKPEAQPEPKPQPAKPEKPKSLRDEAIELAKKLGDKELAKYLEKAPLKSIQRRIKALREEAEKMEGESIKSKAKGHSKNEILQKGLMSNCLFIPLPVATGLFLLLFEAICF